MTPAKKLKHLRHQLAQRNSAQAVSEIMSNIEALLDLAEAALELDSKLRYGARYPLSQIVGGTNTVAVLEPHPLRHAIKKLEESK